MLVTLLAVALSTPGFLSQPSMLSLLTTVSFIGCVAVGMTFVILSGGIDLSVGSVLASAIGSVYPNFRFQHLDLRHPLYNPAGKVDKNAISAGIRAELARDAGKAQ